MKKVTISLYSFNELGEQSKEKAISQHTNFLNSVEDFEEGEYSYDYRREDVISHIELNEYLFFQDGELAPCIISPSGLVTTFNFHGESVEI